MIVKICGIKTLETACAALEAGADMLGFNFYPPSSRYIEPAKCAEIITQLPLHNAALVGIFVNEKTGHIRAVMERCGLDFAQLAGDESATELAALDKAAFKAIRPRTLAEADEQRQAYDRPTPPALLVDAHIKGAYGGTGETGDWAIAKHLATQTPILLAGGLDPENVTVAVQAVRPWGVDVASGVESAPGVKAPAKITAFITAAKAA